MLEIDKMYCGDCLGLLPAIPEDSIDAIVTDPPYELAFMGRGWDKTGIAYNTDMWAGCLRVLKPGGHLLAFGGSRTYHRMACAIEDAGFEIRDSLHWVYGCLSSDTEIMINGQWEHYHKANIGDLTICYSNETNSYSWQPIQEVFEYRIKDTAYRIQSDLTDQIVTRGHRCLIERKGKLLFCFAEEAAQERKIHVPVLEDLQGLFKALPVPYTRAGAPEHDMLLGLCKNSDGAGEGRTAKEGKYRTDLPCLRQDVSNLEGMGEAGQNKLLLPTLQWCPSGRGVEEARAQRPRGMVRRDQEELCFEDNGVGKFCMEGRRDLLQNSRELCGCEICQMPSEISINGPQRRLCDGTPLNSCSENKAMPEEIRGCASYQPRSNRQPIRESSTIQNQPGPQEIRGTGITRTTLARIEPIEYDGIVWCVRVPTGAFVARRDGKIFVTGNSGFPKSLDISKKLDQMAGAEREIIGYGTNGMGRMNQNNAKAGYRPNPYSDGIDGVPITAPATPAAKQWSGWGTALKPAHEPIVLARKPLEEKTVAANVLRWGTGGLCIDGCRISTNESTERPNGIGMKHADIKESIGGSKFGRFPSNLIHDGSPAVMAEFAKAGDRKVGYFDGHRNKPKTKNAFGIFKLQDEAPSHGASSGSAARFFQSCPFTDEDLDYAPFIYCGKASRREREQGLDLPYHEIAVATGDFKGDGRGRQTEHQPAKNFHPTVKPLSLMRYLCRLITPPGGVVLDPFSGSGTTCMAAKREGFRFVGIELSPEYCEIARKRIAAVPARMDKWAEGT